MPPNTLIQVGQKYGLSNCLTVTALASNSKGGGAICLVNCSTCGAKNIPVVARHLKSIKCGCNPKNPKKQFWKGFWLKVNRSNGPNACWPWMAAKDGGGYGIFRDEKTHRLAWEFYHKTQI